MGLSDYWQLLAGGGGFASLLILALPGILSSSGTCTCQPRLERRQVGVEVVGSGCWLWRPRGLLGRHWPTTHALAFASLDPLGWWLFVLTWLQSASSIVYTYLRLEQRELDATPPIGSACAWRAVLDVHGFNLVAVAAFSLADILPPFLFLPYALQWARPSMAA